MVVERIAIELVDRDVELVGAFDQVEAVDREARRGGAVNLDRSELLDAGVGAVAADPLGVEQADADDEVVHRRAARASVICTASGSPL